MTQFISNQVSRIRTYLLYLDTAFFTKINYWNFGFRYKLINLIVLILLFNSLDSISQCIPEYDPQFTAEIIARSSGNDLDEPLISGEEVLLSITYLSSKKNSSRIAHGLIPSFGTGWDVNKTNFQLFNPAFEYRPSIWHSSHEECPPTVKKDIPTLCTYYDINGNFQLCNLECETCPCSDGVKKSEILPSGWFWSHEPGGGPCVPIDYYCPLSLSWGAWGVYSYYINSPVMLDILLTVGGFSDIDSCEVRKDLTIGFQEIYDDIIGCWEDEDNTVREKMFTDSFYIDCTKPAITQVFNKLKVIVYHDENMDGIKNESEELLNNYVFDDYVVTGDSVAASSSYLDYYLLTGNDYEVFYPVDSIEDWILSTPELIELNYSDGVQEKEVEFGFYKMATSIYAPPKEKQILAYPNPVNSSLTVELPHKGFQIELSSPEGIIIHQKNATSSTHTIDMTEFPSGIYFLSISGDDSEKISLLKIVKY